MENEIKSLKEIIQIQDDHIKKIVVGSEDEGLQELLNKWRNKVFECLIDKKRFELILKDNTRNYKNAT
jgi:hypothetical protein